MSSACSGLFDDCLFEHDVSDIRLVSVNSHDSKPANSWDWIENMKPCSSGLILTLFPDLDIVIHYNPYCPRLVISLKCDRYLDAVALKKANYKKNPRLGLVDVPFYYAKTVLPVCYRQYLEDKFADLEDGEF